MCYQDSIIRVDAAIYQSYCSLFRFRSSAKAASSSSGRSAVSAGFSKECTLLAILERRVAGNDDSCRRNLGPPIVQPLSTFIDEGPWPVVRGGVPWRDMS